MGSLLNMLLHFTHVLYEPSVVSAPLPVFWYLRKEGATATKKKLLLNM